ncbi:hypothetical protein IE81DRAFT_342124 [Ceraceosorus guamensis]|uniref:Paf1-domain-containing protein n=1 Tax=Ceraceosorus guamensis TaxID=1522189 RepID=A0A316VUU3_9BASI|nr:hypothetical protein IE81DRAFT_342124 [Ceraceosorus guamensis]PWN41369.1 hypothetical protein IE81DRAFT_342124 [Ceraceosorus guamensis]
MSRKRPDLIERTRYPNPLPLPPYAPKLLSIPAPSNRYAHPSFASRLAAAHALPLVVDANAGMPLEHALLTHAPSWGGPADQDVSREPLDMKDLDGEDRWLLSADLADPPATSRAGTAGAQGADVRAEMVGPAFATSDNVTWLRKTELLASQELQKKERKAAVAQEIIDTSEEAQRARIERTFSATSKPLSELKHPNKPNVHAVSVYDVLPDEQTWATDFSVYRFADPPGRRAQRASDEGRLNAMFIRKYGRAPPLDNYSLYMPTSRLSQLDADPQDFEQDQREQTERFLRRREAGWVGPPMEMNEDDDDDAQPTSDPRHTTFFKLLRDYEQADPYKPTQELILVLAEQPSVQHTGSEDPAEGSNSAYQLPHGQLPSLSSEEEAFALGQSSSNGKQRAQETRAQVAFYHPIQTRAGLRAKRRPYKPRQNEAFFAQASVGHRDLSERERILRLHARAEVDHFDTELPAVPEPDPEMEDEDEDAEADADADADQEAESEASGGERVAPSDDEDDEKDVDGSAVEARSSKQLDASDEEAEGKDSEASRKGEGSPSESEDEGDAEESVNGDEELADLAAEAQGKDDDVPLEGGRSRRSRTTVIDPSSPKGNSSPSLPPTVVPDEDAMVN